MEDKPFWLRAPYAILFDLIRLHRLKPWEIKLKEILGGFMREMRNKGFIDFSASGTALLSSSIIHRLKSEVLLKMEEPPKKPPPKPEENVPPPLPMPLRFEYTSTSIKDIIEALISALDTEAKGVKPRKQLSLGASIQPEIDEFFSDIEARVEEFYEGLVKKTVNYGQTLSFTDICRNLTLIEIIRRFILLLFLVQSGRISITQEEEDRDIEIVLLG